MRKFGLIAAIGGLGTLGSGLLLRAFAHLDTWLWLPGIVLLCGGSALLRSGQPGPGRLDPAVLIGGHRRAAAQRPPGFRQRRGVAGGPVINLVLMRRYSPPEVQIKAAGGIRTLDALLEVRGLGVTRVGATRTAEILNACRERLRMPAMAPAETAATRH